MGTLITTLLSPVSQSLFATLLGSLLYNLCPCIDISTPCCGPDNGDGSSAAWKMLGSRLSLCALDPAPPKALKRCNARGPSALCISFLVKIPQGHLGQGHLIWALWVCVVRRCLSWKPVSQGNDCSDQAVLTDQLTNPTGVICA